MGKLVALRWRMASDSSVAGIGWRVDSIGCTSSAWRLAAVPYPIPVMGQAITVLNGVLYSFGGYSNGVPVAAAYRYDGATWTAIGPLPVELVYAAAVNDGSRVFILGGTGASGASNAMYRYTPESNTYETMAPFGTAVFAAAAVPVNGRIHKFTGSTSGGPTAAHEIYDIASNSWSSGAAYPMELITVSAFTRNGYIYGAGGAQSNALNPTAKTFRYDPAFDAWDDAPIPDLPYPRSGAASIQMPDGALLAAGYLGTAQVDRLSASALVWDGATNTWRPFPHLREPRALLSGALVGGRPVMIGGRFPGDGFSGSREVQVYDGLFADDFDG